MAGEVTNNIGSFQWLDNKKSTNSTLTAVKIINAAYENIYLR